MPNLDSLIDARQLAAKLGAVKDGCHWFEDRDGNELTFTAVANGEVSPEKVCRVCIAGAALLADVMRGLVHPMSMSSSYIDPAARAARTVLGENTGGGEVSSEITRRGTPYVLAVLDRMIAEEVAKVTADPSHVYVVAA